MRSTVHSTFYFLTRFWMGCLTNSRLRDLEWDELKLVSSFWRIPSRGWSRRSCVSGARAKTTTSKSRSWRSILAFKINNLDSVFFDSRNFQKVQLMPHHSAHLRRKKFDFFKPCYNSTPKRPKQSSHQLWMKWALALTKRSSMRKC